MSSSIVMFSKFSKVLPCLNWRNMWRWLVHLFLPAFLSFRFVTRSIRPPEFDDFVFNENKRQSAKVDILAEIRYKKYEEIRYDISKHVKVYDGIMSYDMFGWPKKAKNPSNMRKTSICFHSSHDAVLSNGSTRIQWDQPQWTWLARYS